MLLVRVGSTEMIKQVIVFKSSIDLNLTRCVKVSLTIWDNLAIMKGRLVSSGFGRVMESTAMEGDKECLLERKGSSKIIKNVKELY